MILSSGVECVLNLRPFTSAPCCKNWLPCGIHCVGLFKILPQIDRSIAMTEGPLNVYYIASVYTIIIMPVYTYYYTELLCVINMNNTSPYKNIHVKLLGLVSPSQITSSYHTLTLPYFLHSHELLGLQYSSLFSYVNN